MPTPHTDPAPRPAPDSSGGGPAAPTTPPAHASSGAPLTAGCTDPAGRWKLLVDGMRLALTTLTVVPARVGIVDRRTAAVAMTVAPVIGVPLGALLAAVLILLDAAGAPPLLAAAVTLGTGTLLTRALHLDGLADTVDALGSYRAGEAGLAVMKKPDIGPFGVAALVLTLLIQTAALTSLGDTAPTAVTATIITAWVTGRLAISWACRRGLPPARPTGLGALVADSVPPLALTLATTATVTLSTAAVPSRPWQGPLAVLLSLAATLLLLRQCRRRFGGITGDILGASLELATTITLITLALR